MDREALLPLVASGDQRAVEACMDRYANLVWSLARRFTSSRADAEDAVQEIFIELWTKAGSYDPGKSGESTFVALIARRRLIDRMRKSGRQPATEELTAAADVQPADPVDLAAKADAARAAKLIEGFKPEQREVIRMAVYLGHTHQHIADTLKLPLGTVKTHLRRGLLKVREALRESGS